MSDVGLGQLVTTTGRARSRVLKDAVRDAHPLYEMMNKEGGVRKIDGGRTIVEEAKSGQNTTVKWVGENGTVPLNDPKVLDAAEFDWKYQLGSVTFTLAERYKNSGGSDTKLIDVIGGKFEVLEDSMMNEFHEGMLSNGTGTAGLQLQGVAALVPTVVDSGTIGTIDRSDPNAAWFRTQSSTSTAAVGDATVDASNVKRFFDKGINGTMRNSKLQVQCGFLGQDHFEFLTQATQAIQIIQNVSSTAKVGFDKIIYRSVPMYLGNGINYSGATAATTDRSYLFNVKRGGLNLVFHKKAEFDMLEPVNSSDQAAVSRLMFTMSAMTIGGLAKFNWVGYDG